MTCITLGRSLRAQNHGVRRLLLAVLVFVACSRSRDEHEPAALERVRGRHEHRRVDEGSAACIPALHTLGGRRDGGRRVVDDPRALRDALGEWLEDGVDRSIVGERKVEALGAGESGSRVRERACAVGLERARLCGSAIPDVDVMAVGA